MQLRNAGSQTNGSTANVYAFLSHDGSVCSSAPPAPAVARRPNQDGPTPSLHPHYQASSLLRVGPSLHCPGSVLCPLRVLPLGVLPLAPGQALACPFAAPRVQLPTFHVGA